MITTFTDEPAPAASSERLWAPLGESAVFGADGFIVAPGGLFPAQNPEVVAVGELGPLLCVVVLGEPGAGKSTVLQAEYERTRAAHPRSLWVDLGGFGDAKELADTIFRDPVWSADSPDEGDVFLFLDALDEARLRIPVIRDVLLRGLAAVDAARLRLRVACRAAQWPASLTDQLAKLWPEHPPVVRYPLPLRRDDVAAVAQEAGLDGEAFVVDAVRLGVAPLAAHPLTLKLLIAGALAGDGMPATQVEAYRRGLRLLCEEPDEDRRDDPQTAGRLGSGARLAVARRIAAAVVLAGKASVWNGPDSGEAPSRSVVRGALIGGFESDDDGAVGTRLPVDESAVIEALRTGVFTAGSDSRELQFAHQSFGEFLAASWLSGLDFERVASLICLPDDPERRVIPQLQGVAVWLAVLHADVFAHLLAVDADLLLRPSLARVAPEQRAAVVDALLGLVEQERVDLYDGSVRRALADLAHPVLDEQLLAVLGDPERPARVREFACEIASACGLTTLTGALVDLALDASAPVRLRTRAVLAVDEIAVGDTQRSRLLELASGQLEDELADELKGAALSATWPHVMNAEQVFAAITAPRQPDTIGLYTSFMSSELLDRLPDGDVPIALRWAADHYDPYGLEHLDLLAVQILTRAWAQIDNDEIVDLIAGIVRTLLDAHLTLLQQSAVDTNGLFVDESGRRQLVRRFIEPLARGEMDPTHVVHSEPPLVVREDLPWVLEQLTASLAANDERGWAMLANHLWSHNDDESAALIWDAMETSPELAQIASDRFAAILLDSEIARSNRQWYARSKQISERRAAQEAERQAWNDALAQRLNDALSDPHITWPQLSSTLTGERLDSFLREAEQRTVDSPGFELVDSEQRQIVIDLAERFLSDAEPGGDDWLDTSEVPSRAISAARALDLLLSEAPVTLDGLTPDAWARWATALVAHPGGQDAKGQAVSALRQRANAIHPDRVANALIRLIAGENRRTGRAWQLEHADELHSPQLEAGLVQLLHRGGQRPEAVADIVAYGLRANYASIRQWALTAVDRVTSVSWAQIEHVVAIRVAVKLLQGARDAGWSSIWPAIETSTIWGCELAGAVVEVNAPRLDQAVDESSLAELFCWLQQHFPAEQDPQQTLIVSQRTRIAWWRDSLLKALVDAGTEDAVRLLAELRDRFPSLTGLSTLWVQANEQRRRSAWAPPSPAAVIALGSDRHKRLVSGDLDLLRVVLEALNRTQQRLQPPNPAAADLWDTAVHKPKTEEDISDWLQRRLQDEFAHTLTVIDREVQVSRLPGPGIGERTDLLIQAAAGQDLDDAEMITLVIEVKGCWNQDLNRDMAGQLADRYLPPHNRRCGVYLIVWFGSTGWNAEDHRRRRCADSKDSLQHTYRQQAEQLSAERGLELRSVVLDGSLPESRQATRRRTRTGPS